MNPCCRLSQSSSYMKGSHSNGEQLRIASVVYVERHWKGAAGPIPFEQLTRCA
ncbi:MAG TPA: hypothetical protein VN688_33620 [Gemmataceae bacterium]|nr:hypothetical protein [Gemmataceae bacterium]